LLFFGLAEDAKSEKEESESKFSNLFSPKKERITASQQSCIFEQPLGL
jgi:hypothetical protein